jgi:hypothetical protein
MKALCVAVTDNRTALVAEGSQDLNGGYSAGFICGIQDVGRTANSGMISREKAPD